MNNSKPMNFASYLQGDLEPRQKKSNPKFSFFQEQSESDLSKLSSKSGSFWQKSSYPTAFDKQEILKEGYLSWLTPVKTWKNFFFRLLPNKLLYYFSPIDLKEQGILNLGDSLTLEFSKFQKQDEIFFSFILSTKSHSQELCSKDKKEIISWIDELKFFTIRFDFFNSYSFMGMLGQGNFAEVHKVKSTLNGEIFAAKIFTKESLSKKSKENIKKEIKILKMLYDREQFLQLYEVFEEEDSIMLITEYLDGGDLYSKLKQFKTFTESQTLTIFKQIVIALEQLKSIGIVHRDLKLENVLLKTTKDQKKTQQLTGFGSNSSLRSKEADFSNYIVKIADFGLADLLPSKKAHLKTRCGTPGFIAPEVFGGSGYNEKVDIFSAGIILYTLLNGSPPFKGKDMKTIVQKTRTQKIHFKKQK